MDTTEDTVDTHDADEPVFSASNVAIVTVVILVLMSALALAGYSTFTSDDHVVDVVPERPGLPGTMVPTEPAPAEPAGALVGMTEAEVRATYPRVRVVEEDGEPRPSTMDLQQGRINLTMRDGVVLSSFTEGCEDTTPSTPAWIRQACSPDPESDGPDAFGKLIAGDGAFSLEVGTMGDQQYQGMAVVVDPERTLLIDSNGSPLDEDQLRSDDVVTVWVSACAESSPVQCSIDVIALDRAA